jgi:DnaJ-class molecular chaperone
MDEKRLEELVEEYAVSDKQTIEGLVDDLRELIAEIGADCDPRSWPACRRAQAKANKILDTIEYPLECPTCAGSGDSSNVEPQIPRLSYAERMAPCPDCGGTGRISHKEE